MKNLFNKQFSLTKLFKKIFNFLFPSFCMGCGLYNSILCTKCVQKIKPVYYTKCDWIYPLFDYHDPIIRKMIWHLKYRNKTIIAICFADLLHEHILEYIGDKYIFNEMNSPLLIPIPLSKNGLRKRGYNQSLLIAKRLSFINKEYFKFTNNILYKIKDTKKQVDIKNRNERLKNLNESFLIKNKKLVHKQDVILIDDVVTTGATLCEAKKVLKKAGAKNIIAFTIAH